MTDATTNEPLRVSTDSPVRPYIDVAEIQLDEVCRLLDSRHINYWVDEHAISLDGGPETTIIHLDHGADAGAIQAILDSVR